MAPTVPGPEHIEPTGATVRNVPCVGLPFIYGGQPWGLPLPRVVRLLDDFAPDAVHAVCPMLLGWAGVLHAERRRLPLVCSYHTRAARYARYCRLGFAEGLVWAIVCWAHRHSRVDLAATEASRDALPQGVRGRLAAEKGLEQLLPLAAPSRDRHVALVGFGATPTMRFSSRPW